MKTKNTSHTSIKSTSSTPTPVHGLRLPDLRIPLCLGLFVLVYFGLEWGLKH
jgi:hypothetical protein